MTLMLIGNPNVGKTTLFNYLTGSDAQVANWAGATVDKLVGTIADTDQALIDLPGTYSLTPNSEDEGVVTYAMLHEEYEGIINIVDASRLKRNLHLTIQLLESGKPVVVALNMMDELESQGKILDAAQLEQRLGTGAVPVTARKKIGIGALMERVVRMEPSQWRLDYGPTVEGAIAKLMELFPRTRHSARWLAIQILEGNGGILATYSPELKFQISLIVKEAETQILKTEEALSLKGAIFNKRRAFISELCNQCVASTRPRQAMGKWDHLLTHPVWGMAIFFSLMFLVYTLTFDWVGNPLSAIFDAAIHEGIAPWVQRWLVGFGFYEGGIIYEGISQGVLRGVGGVIVFIPQILVLFFCLAVMEGTGYMARVALVMDDVFSRFGLNGKAVVPLITGFGCNVPAMMATRTIKDRNERLKTIAIIPFMSCSARLPVYVLFVGLFFPNRQALIIMGLYLLGMAVALGSAKLLSATTFRSAEDPFVLEVPPYRVPQLGLVWRQTLHKGKDFLSSAGKFIVIGSLMMWFLQYAGPGGLNVESNESFLAIIGGFLAPVFAPIGLGDWEIASSLVVGFLAKELLASSMLIIAGSEAAIVGMLTAAQALSFLTFSLLYVPCLATIGVMYRESKSLKDTALMVFYGLGVAYAVSFLVFQIVRAI